MSFVSFNGYWHFLHTKAWKPWLALVPLASDLLKTNKTVKKLLEVATVMKNEAVIDCPTLDLMNRNYQSARKHHHAKFPITFCTSLSSCSRQTLDQKWNLLTDQKFWTTPIFSLNQNFSCFAFRRSEWSGLEKDKEMGDPYLASLGDIGNALDMFITKADLAPEASVETSSITW